jgi:Phage P22-like portal protein
MPTLPLRTSQEAKEDKDIFAECTERLRIATQAEGENRNNAILALEFEDGQQWPDDLYNLRKINRRPTLTINHTRTMVRRVVNNMRQQRPRIKVQPVGSGADIDLADKIGGLIRHIETRSDGAIAYDVGGESAVKIGWGYWRIVSEYVDEKSFEQELKLLPVRNTFTVYIDPAAQMPAGEDMDWCIISEMMKRSEYERKFPKEDQIEWREGAAGDEFKDWETEEQIRLAEYFRITRRKDTLVKLSDGRDVYGSEFDRGAFATAGLSVAKNLKGQEIRRPTERRQVEWYRINGTKIVQSVELPGHWIPVVRCEGNTLDLNGTIRRKGMVADLMDTGRMYNYWRTCETEMIALAPRAPWLVSAGQTDGHPEWKDANQKPYSTLVYEPTWIEQPDGSKTPLPPPVRTEPVAIPAGFVNAAESAAKDLMALAGMPHEPGVDKPGEVISGKALERRQALSDIGHFQYYDNQTRSIAHTGRILLDLIPHYYREPGRIQRIVNPDSTPQVITLNQQSDQKILNDMTVGRYDVVMDVGPGYETKRLEQAELTVDLLKIGPLAEAAVKSSADLIFRYFEMNDIADRLVAANPEGLKKAIEQLPKDAQGIVMGLYQQLQQAQQVIQQQGMEIKYKGGIAQMQEQAETQRHQLTEQTKRADIVTESQTKLHDTHTRAQASIAVAEIGAAGKMLDSHVQGRYDVEAAKHALKAGESAKPKS